MNIKKLPIIMIILSAIIFDLSGCAKVDDVLSEKIVKKSGIYENETYRKYESFSEQYEIDLQGYYFDAEGENTINEKSIHVTFAQNSYLSISYYADENKETSIDPYDYWINPGDSVYATVDFSGNAIGNMYMFSGFRIYEFDEEGKRTPSTLIMGEEGDHYTLHVPQSFTGKDLAIEPLGNYKKRIIRFKSTYKDENEQEYEGTGIWMVGDKECNSRQTEVNPVSSYMISYKYDKNEYFFVSSTPDSFYVNDYDGKVIFEQKEADDETEDYMVELHKYFSEVLVSDADRKYRINGDPNKSGSVKANSEIRFEHLRYGDVITLETDREWPDLENETKFVLEKFEKEQIYQASMYAYKYTLIVPEKDGEFLFDPSEYSYEHGRIGFTVCGQKVITPQKLPKGRKIYYEQLSADTGYWLSGNPSSHCVTVTGENTKEKLQNIHFILKKNVTVFLPQPDVGGSVMYWLNGQRINKESCETYSGAVIKMKFNPWPGWMCKDDNYIGEVTYKVGDEMKQTVSLGGKSVKDAFVEDEGHKPELSVRLEKSVGTTMEFKLEASGYRMDVESYGGGWKVTDIFNPNAKTYNIINNDQIIVSGRKIGTDMPIHITMGKRAIQSGKAVRTIITLTDSNNKKTSETRYVDDLSVENNPIYIYSNGSNAYQTTWYKSIDITIGVVDIYRFNVPLSMANSRITVTNIASNRDLAENDFIEGSEMVMVRIWPYSGYYITGKNVVGDMYSEKMKYSDYVKRLSEIRQTYLPEKYRVLSLDESDTFAKYTYKLDGTVVSGEVKAKIGQKLELTYEIVDKIHKLKESEGGFFGIGASNTKAIKTITISSDMVVNRSSFGIEIK